MNHTLSSPTQPSQTTTSKPTNSSQRLWQLAWTDEDTFGSVLLVLLIDRYGAEALSWAPETIRIQVQNDFNVQLPKANFDKLMAAITVVTTNYFYKDVAKFIQLCNILSGDDFDPNIFDPADSIEIAWGVTEVLLLDPPEEEEPFTEEIRAYITAVLKDEGFVTAPDVLKLGLDADLSRNIGGDFADDPEMFQAIHESQIGKAEEVETLLREQLQDLMRQLRGLPLKHGSADGLLQKLQKGSHEQAQSQ